MAGDGPLAPLVALDEVTEATARRLHDAGVEAADIREKRVSRASLVAAGVPAGDADRIRRAHGLAWSFYVGEGDLLRRAARVRGLTPEERAWVAASAADWEGAARGRTQSRTDLASIPGVSEADADRLVGAGITSVEALASVDAGDLADVLGVDVRHLRTWRSVAERGEF